MLQAKLQRAPKRVACEFEAFSPQLFLGWNAPLVEIDAIMFELRRRKDADELRMLARANEANRAMYEHARRDRAAGRERAGRLFRAAGGGGAHAGRAADVFRPGFSRRRTRRAAARSAGSRRASS